MTPEGSVIMIPVIPLCPLEKQGNIKTVSVLTILSHLLCAFCSFNWLNCWDWEKSLVRTVGISVWKRGELKRVEKSVGRDWRDSFVNNWEDEIVKNSWRRKNRLMVGYAVVVVEKVGWWKIKKVCIEYWIAVA